MDTRKKNKNNNKLCLRIENFVLLISPNISFENFVAFRFDFLEINDF